jgi:hypothetical protein
VTPAASISTTTIVVAVHSDGVPSASGRSVGTRYARARTSSIVGAAKVPSLRSGNACGLLAVDLRVVCNDGVQRACPAQAAAGRTARRLRAALQRGVRRGRFARRIGSSGTKENRHGDSGGFHRRTAVRLGRAARVRLPRRRHQRLFRRAARAGGKIEFIQARHEEMAAFMASAHAKFTGELGVCVATSGPGAAHLVTGLYDARLDHMPVLAIVGQQARTALGGHYQQEVDLPALFKDVAGAFVQLAVVPGQVRHLVDRAVRTALGARSRRWCCRTICRS